MKKNAPTLNLIVTDDTTSSRLVDLTDLPVPVHVTPDGHVIVDDLAPYFQTAAQAFADTWTRMAGQQGRP
ncbi:tensin-4 [Bifidobacterium aerophilum]|uniref:Tensin-4 n=1 Tax=Bifidobacterium aerophilum TaxID=1798155 RepID=A0A6N9Z3W8_9BIFI|nr:tensin-4 [Bifidobacterium aerophilum]NEG89166.1 tensin-4 [Bifidobacterium aerophilum]